MAPKFHQCSVGILNERQIRWMLLGPYEAVVNLGDKIPLFLNYNSPGVSEVIASIMENGKLIRVGDHYLNPSFVTSVVAAKNIAMVHLTGSGLPLRIARPVEEIMAALTKEGV